MSASSNEKQWRPVRLGYIERVGVTSAEDFLARVQQELAKFKDREDLRGFTLVPYEHGDSSDEEPYRCGLALDAIQLETDAQLDARVNHLKHYYKRSYENYLKQKAFYESEAGQQQIKEIGTLV